MNLSSALEYSSQLPVSVYGTGCLARFSWRLLSWIIHSSEESWYYHRVSPTSTHYSVSAHQRHNPVAFSAGRYQNIN
jgi:hypothetical protein